ncbi:MAG: ECF transporter S component [Clostridia bacterium]|nr:ECF transporter S component [Clostridia bacterium]
MEKVKKTTFFTAKNIAYFAVLVALVVVLQMFGGNIQIAGLSLNLALVPIALGAILFGPAGGALLGFICGFIVTMYGVTGAEAFTFYLFNSSPLATILICLVKTTAAGAVAGCVYWLIAKKNKIVAVFVTAAIVPIVNTGIFAIGCFVIYDDILSYLALYGLDYSAENAFYVVFVVVITWNFFIELLTSLLLAPAVATVTRIVEKQIAKNSKKKKAANVNDEPDGNNG